MYKSAKVSLFEYAPACNARAYCLAALYLPKVVCLRAFQAGGGKRV
jgi:hypothetical protein